MDLLTLDTTKQAEKGAVLKLRNPGTGEYIEGMTITLLGEDSAVYRNKSKAIAEEKLNANRKRKVNLDSIENENLQVLAACTVEWTGFEEGKNPIECTAEEVVRIYRKYKWIREQVDSFIGDRANFLA